MPVATAPHSPPLRHRRRHETQPRRLRTLHVRASSRSPHRPSARARTLPRLRTMTTTLTPYRSARHSRPTPSLAHASPLRPIDRERQGRRLVNIAVAAMGLVVASPVLLLIAALIKLTSRG